ncbi:hypothetical protein AGMMS50233_04690 [Endomicrobiia bacterium]|nr:hypothetical protein AGMMS50233_04690 [Endomicrobiia bacterium]
MEYGAGATVEETVSTETLRATTKELEDARANLENCEKIEQAAREDARINIEDLHVRRAAAERELRDKQKEKEAVEQNNIDKQAKKQEIKNLAIRRSDDFEKDKMRVGWKNELAALVKSNEKLTNGIAAATKIIENPKTKKGNKNNATTMKEDQEKELALNLKSVKEIENKLEESDKAKALDDQKLKEVQDVANKEALEAEESLKLVNEKFAKAIAEYDCEVKHIAEIEGHINDDVEHVAYDLQAAEGRYTDAQKTVLGVFTEFMTNNDDVNNQLAQEIRTLEDRRDGLNDELDQILHEQTAISKEYNSKLANQAILEDKILATQENFEKTNVALGDAEETHNNALKELEEYENSVPKTDEPVQEAVEPDKMLGLFQQNVTDFKYDLDGLSQERNDLLEGLKEQAKGLDTLPGSNRVDELKRVYEELDRRRFEVNDELAMLQRRQEKAKEEQNNLQTALADARASVSSFGSDNFERVTVNADRIRLERYEREIQRQEEIIDNLGREDTRLRGDFECLKGDIDETVEELRNIDETMANIDRDIEARQEETNSASADAEKKNALVAVKEQIEKEKQRLVERRAQLHEKVFGLDNDVNNIGKRIASTDHSKHEAIQELQKYKQKKEEELEKVVERNIELKRLRERTEELAERLNGTEKRIAQLQEELEKAVKPSKEDKIAHAQAGGRRAQIEEIKRRIEELGKYEIDLLKEGVEFLENDLKETERLEAENERKSQAGVQPAAARADKQKSQAREIERLKEGLAKTQAAIEMRKRKIEELERGDAGSSYEWEAQGEKEDRTREELAQSNERERENEELKERLAVAQEETEIVKEEAQKAATLVKEEATVEIVRAEEKTREAEKEIARLNEENRKLKEKERSAGEQDADGAFGSGARATEKVESLMREREELRTELEKVKEEAEQAKKEVDGAKKETERVMEEVAKEQEENKKLRAELNKAKEEAEQAKQKLTEQRQGTPQTVAVVEQKNTAPNVTKIVVNHDNTGTGSGTQGQTGSKNASKTTSNLNE